MPSPTKKLKLKKKRKNTHQGKRRKSEIKRTERQKIEDLGKKLGLT